MTECADRSIEALLGVLDAESSSMSQLVQVPIAAQLSQLLFIWLDLLLLLTSAVASRVAVCAALHYRYLFGALLLPVWVPP